MCATMADPQPEAHVVLIHVRVARVIAMLGSARPGKGLMVRDEGPGR